MVALTPEIAATVDRVIVRGPLGVLLGMELLELEESRARLRMPYRPELTTTADIVHGGAIAALIDTAGTAAVWARPDASPGDRGATVGFSVNFLVAARGETVTATARVRRRGHEISIVEVSVGDTHDVEVAVALLTYKLRRG